MTPEEIKQPQQRPDVMRTISNILSAVFLPLLVPTYAYAIAMWMTYLSLLPEKNRFITCALIFFITAVIPLGTILFLMRKGKVSDPAISNHKERVVPYTVTTLCYFLATALLIFSRAPMWLSMFFAGAGIAAVIDATVNIWWKISAHTTSLGGLTALVLFIGVHHLAVVSILPWVIVTVVISGLVGTARVYLGRHTPGQVYAGWLVGFVISFLAMTLFN